MCNRFRSVVGKEWKPGDALPLEFLDGTPAEGVWAGFATREKLRWWLRQPGNQLAQSELVESFAERTDDSGDIIWGPVSPATHFLFVVQPPLPGKSYQLARMITDEANPEQATYFRHGRIPLFGTLSSEGDIVEVSQDALPPPPPKAQGELF